MKRSESSTSQAVSTFGIGTELSRKQWLQVGRRLVQKGLLVQDEQFGGLSLTALAFQVLRDKEPIFGVWPEEDASVPAKSKGETEYDRPLFDLLRKLRKELADAAVRMWSFQTAA